MYFVKITSSWTPSNSLQKYIKTKVDTLDKVCVEAPDSIFEFLKSHYALANRTFKRCTKEEPTMRKAHTGEDIFIDCSICQLSLYKSNGNFDATPAPVVPTVAILAPQVTSGEILTLFN